MMKYFALFLALAAPAVLVRGYEEVQPKTPVGKIVVLDLPPRTALETTSGEPYFSSSDGMFRRLFGYIQKNNIKMTTPVEVDINPGKMRFFVGSKDTQRKGVGDQNVNVTNLKARKVLSIGVRGGYTEGNFITNKKKLLKWLRNNSDYKAAGKAYAVYWNGPFMPGFLKRSEIHIPIRIK